MKTKKLKCVQLFNLEGREMKNTLIYFFSASISKGPNVLKSLIFS